MPTRDEIRARLAAEERRSGPARTPGGRFRCSELAIRLASGGSLNNPASGERVAVTEGPEQLADFLRTRAFDTSLLELMDDAPRQIQVRPTPTALLQLVTIVPTDTVRIPTVPESFQVEDAAAVPDAVNLPGLSGGDIADFTVDNLEAVRVGRVVPVALDVLQDVGQAEATIDRLISQNWARAIEGYVVAGPSSNANLTGIINTPGVAEFSVGSATAIDTIALAVAAVSTAGFYGPHAVVAHPLTLERIFTLKDTADQYLRRHEALPTVAAYVPAPGVPDGTVIVCDPTEVLLYLMGQFSVLVSQGFLDFLSRNLALVKGEQRAACWIRNPGAFVIGTGF